MMEGQIKWLPLRLNVLPLVDRQARAVLQVYLATHREITEGDILSIQKLVALKQEIAARIKDIDAFYNRSALDPRAKYIYATRSLLAKIVEQQNQFEKINDDNMNESNFGTVHTPPKNTFPSVFAIASTTTHRKQPSQQKNSQNNKALTARSPFEHSLGNIYQREAEKDRKVMRLGDLKKEHPKSKTAISMREQERKAGEEEGKAGEKGTFRKTQQGASKKGTGKKIEQVAQLQREKVEMSNRLERSPYAIKKSFKDLSELVFTIKMTKQEYNEFMRLKRKNNHA